MYLNKAVRLQGLPLARSGASRMSTLVPLAGQSGRLSDRHKSMLLTRSAHQPCFVAINGPSQIHRVLLLAG